MEKRKVPCHDSFPIVNNPSPLANKLSDPTSNTTMNFLLELVMAVWVAAWSFASRLNRQIEAVVVMMSLLS